MIQVEGLSKFYTGRAAVEDVSFEIAEGETVGLLGLNGAGKSTILKILGCFLMPSAGSAKIAGFDISKNQDDIRKIIGYLPDTPPLYNEMTVESYLRYVAKLKDVVRSSLDAYISDAIDSTNLAEVVDFRLGELSHGFRQRVCIAQALVHKPKFLIFDEPINGLDPVQIVEMRDLIKSLAGRHTVVLSSHILSEITKTCDRILIIDKGRLVAQGAESELSKTLMGRGSLSLSVQGWNDALCKAVKNIEGVVGLKETSPEGMDVQINIDTDRDVRAEVAKVVVEAGASLVGLQRDGGGLEKVFVQMINRSTEGRDGESS